MTQKLPGRTVLISSFRHCARRPLSGHVTIAVNNVTLNVKQKNYIVPVADPEDSHGVH